MGAALVTKTQHGLLVLCGPHEEEERRKVLIISPRGLVGAASLVKRALHVPGALPYRSAEETA